MYTQQFPRRFCRLGDVMGRAGLGAAALGCAAVLATALSARNAETAPASPAPTGRAENFRAELPNLLCPLSLIIDDGTPVMDDRLPAAEMATRRAQGMGTDRWAVLDDFATLCESVLKCSLRRLPQYERSIGRVCRGTRWKRIQWDAFYYSDAP